MINRETIETFIKDLEGIRQHLIVLEKTAECYNLDTDIGILEGIVRYLQTEIK